MPEKPDTYWIYEYQGLTSVDNARYWKCICKSQNFFELVMLSKKAKVSDRKECTQFRIVRKKYEAARHKSGNNVRWLVDTHVLSEVMDVI